MSDSEGRRELVAKVRRGDREAFALLTGSIEVDLRHLIGSRLRARRAFGLEAEEILQETLARGLASLVRFHGENAPAFRRWLAGIAEHVIVDGLRRAARGPFVPLARDPTGEGTSPSTAMRRDERFTRLEEAMDALSPEHRRVIVLSRIDGLGFHEIALRMGRSPAAAKQILWRALQKLREIFGDTESFHLPDRCLPSAGGKDGNQVDD